jgi:Tat protein secretion system quality control protein TatD with DNase activity
MRIAIDFDETYSADPEFFAKFVALARKHNHQPCIVSCRRATVENHELVTSTVGDEISILVVFTDLQPKRVVMEELGLPVDIWIDDSPDSVERGRQ